MHGGGRPTRLSGYVTLQLSILPLVHHLLGRANCHTEAFPFHELTALFLRRMASLPSLLLALDCDCCTLRDDLRGTARCMT